MAAVTDKVLSWLCRGGNSSTTNVSIILHPQEHRTPNTCSTDIVLFSINLVFCILTSLVFFFVRLCNISRTTDHDYIIRYPGHVIRWLLYILYILICLTMLGEGILTSNQHHFGAPPIMYISPLAALLASIFVMLYYHYMEYWDLLGMWPLQFSYWVSLLIVECFRAFDFYRDDITSRHMIWVVNKSMIAVDGTMCLIEIYLLIKKGFSLVSSNQIHSELKERKYLHDDCSLPSALLYSWMNGMFKKGMKEAIEIDDMGSLPEEHSAKYSSERFAKILLQEKERARKKGREISFNRALFHFLKKGLYVSGILKFVGDSSGFATPYLISGIITWATLQGKDSGETGQTYQMTESYYITAGDFFSNGFVLVIALFFQLVFQKICTQLSYHYVILDGAKARAAIQSAVYSKTLRLSTSGIGSGSLTQGQIANHMSVDPRSIFLALQWIHSIWSIPYQVIVFVIILYFELGFSALVSCLVLPLSIPIQIYIANRQTFYQKGAMIQSDERLKQTNEVLQGMKVVKLNAWEKIFQKAIEITRRKEVKKLRIQMLWRVQLNTLANAVPLLLMLFALSLYSVFSGKSLTPDVAFTSLSVINQLQLPLQLLPRVSAFFVIAVVSMRRLGKFFKAPEIEGNLLTGNGMNGDIVDEEDKEKVSDSSALIKKLKNGNVKEYGATHYTRLANGYSESDAEAIPMMSINADTLPSNIALKVTNGSFSWSGETRTPIISNVNIDILAGKLTMIVGRIGAGKSSLLAAMLDEMITLNGDIKQRSKKIGVAYAAQTAWLINASLKDNILFGKPFNYKRYKRILHACCLQPDIDILPMGDQTEIGEKGINLSGGQKQRISVARAMYSSYDVVILDDPLSALDVHVGSHMFFKGILDFLIEEGRTVVLVTHQVQYLDHADQVIYLQDGYVARKGTMREIEQEDPSLVKSWNVTLKTDEIETAVGYCSSTDEEREVLKKRVSKSKKGQQNDIEIIDESSSKLIGSEERNRGSVSIWYYWYYLCKFGLCQGFLVCLFAILQNVATAGTQFWLSAWSSAGAKLPDNATVEESNAVLKKYVGIYCVLNGSDILLGTVWTTILLIQCVHTSKTLHNMMLTRILRAPMRFFDTTPLGRIMNRFASDMQKLDQTQGPFILGLFKFLLSTLAGVVVNAIISWYFIVAMIPITLAYMILMKVFIDTSREMQRLVSISNSPVFSHFSETLGGLTTIRAYRLQKRFKKNIIGKIERNHVSFCFLQDSNRWLGIRLDLTGCIMVLAAGLTSLAASSLHPATFGASLVGLAITYACKAAYSLTWVVRNATSVEMGMNSVERIEYYTKVDNEKYRGSITPKPSWPDKGHVTYNRVYARYAANLPAVLQGVNIDFKPGMKVGICGRTGSGKSSLTLTLFRIIDTFKGVIKIDGVDISKLSLTDLRGRLAIIPQDPVMFTGTVRFNLDPEERRTDTEIWDALEIAQLKKHVSDLPNSLDSMVYEGGDNFSVGEKQLFCLARAMLKKSRILIMDEATASIDVHTDAILQEVVATAFKEETVITIAHRVSTILDSDQIVVLSEGHVAELGTPESLLAKEDSIFASLVRAKS